jgi:RimJ/RimL family protein N-acetyltransferase
VAPVSRPCLIGSVLVQTERLVLRRFRDADAEPFAAINGDPEVMRYIADGRPLDPAASDALLQRIAREWAERGHGLWAVEERSAPGRLLGFCGLAVPTFLPRVLPAVEVGWRLSRDAWGRGLATEAAGAALAFGFERLGLAQILAVVHPDNARSLRVAAKLGMTARPDQVHPATRGRLRVLGVERPS